MYNIYLESLEYIKLKVYNLESVRKLATMPRNKLTSPLRKHESKSFKTDTKNSRNSQALKKLKLTKISPPRDHSA